MDISKEQHEFTVAYNSLMSSNSAYDLSNVGLISIIDYINGCIQSSASNGFFRADISVRLNLSDSDLIDQVVKILKLRGYCVDSVEEFGVGYYSLHGYNQIIKCGIDANNHKVYFLKINWK
jgi:nicotinic acid phosphoribosyltransferase